MIKTDGFPIQNEVHLFQKLGPLIYTKLSGVMWRSLRSIFG